MRALQEIRQLRGGLKRRIWQDEGKKEFISTSDWSCERGEMEEKGVESVAERAMRT